MSESVINNAVDEEGGRGEDSREVNKRYIVMSGVLGLAVLSLRSGAVDEGQKFIVDSSSSGESPVTWDGDGWLGSLEDSSAPYTVGVRETPSSVNVQAGDHLEVEPQLSSEEYVRFGGLADSVFSVGNWEQAQNFSHSYVAFMNSGVGLDLSSPGRITVRDPLGLGQEAGVNGVADNVRSSARILLVPNTPQMVEEFNLFAQPAHDSLAFWVSGNGNVEIVYVWNDDSRTRLTLEVIEGRRLVGNRTELDSQGKEVGSGLFDYYSLQYIQFGRSTEGQTVVLNEPKAVIVNLVAKQGDFLTLDTGPTSFYDTDGVEGTVDWQDRGWRIYK